VDPAATLRKLFDLAAAARIDPAVVETASQQLLDVLLEVQQLRRALGPKRLRALQRARRAEALRRAGLSGADIGKRLGLSRQRVKQLLDERVIESASEQLGGR
jgi:hypothetical protein